jgi:outer membrane protein OmpA-like peptidoglycan-associated protein
MKSIRFIILSLSYLLAACTGTTVVLLPDSDGNVGQVELITDGGKTVLDKAYESAEAKKGKLPPSQKILLTNEIVRDEYGDILANEPLVPDHFRFYFNTGKADLQPEAREALIKSKARIEERKSCDLSVIGHTDRVEDDDFNYLLSMVRATNVAKALIAMGISQNCMDIRYYGESYPVIPTLDEVDEPRNRRVEIEIR